MIYLLAGLVLFFGVHTIPMFPSFKALLQTRIGPMRFKGVFSLFSIAGFALIIIGMAHAPYQSVFTPPAWGARLANLVMPVAFCLLVAAYIPSSFRLVIRNPMLSGVLLWALVHLTTNGNLASVLLFGSFAAYAAIDILSVNRRSPAPTVARQNRAMDVLVLGIGFAAFWAVRHFHGPLFGVAV